MTMIDPCTSPLAARNNHNPAPPRTFALDHLGRRLARSRKRHALLVL